MIGKDMLSQEEIDALLRQDTGSEITKFPLVQDYINALEADVLGEIGNISFGNASTALSSLLGQKVDITTPEVDVVFRKDLHKEFPQPHVVVHVEYTEGFSGISLLVLKVEDASIIADLMLGNDGTQPREMGELEISACQEAMNQMMGSAATSMSTIFNKIVNISPPGINILDISEDNELLMKSEDDVLVRISFRLIVGSLIDSKIMQIMPVRFARDMVATLLGSNTLSPDSQDQLHTETVTSIVSEPIHTEPDKGKIQEEIQVHHQAQATIPNPVSSSPQFIGGQSGMTRTPNVTPIQFSDFGKPKETPITNEHNLNLLLDIPLQVTVELGRTKKMIKEILELGPGSIVELDKLAGEPVEILVNNKLIAKGEVVVIDENFGVRVTEIVSQWERLMKLQ